MNYFEWTLIDLKDKTCRAKYLFQLLACLFLQSRPERTMAMV